MSIVFKLYNYIAIILVCTVKNCYMHCCTMEDKDLDNQEFDDSSILGPIMWPQLQHLTISVHLPAFLAYLSLGFKVISTTIVVLMAGWIIITIKTIRSLHKTHNIYVVYLMAMDLMYAINITMVTGAMMIGCFTGVGDFIDCNVLIFMYYPTGIMFLIFLLMLIDKVIAITFPFKHREFMNPRVVCGIVVAKHLSVVMIYTKNILFLKASLK